MGQRELEVLGEELLDVGATDAVGLLDLNDLDDLYAPLEKSGIKTNQGTYGNRAEAGTVTSSHVLVKSIDGIGTAHLTELLVHVVGTRARVVTDPDTEVLDLHRALLVDLGTISRDHSHMPIRPNIPR